MRSFILISALLVVAILGFLTAYVIFASGRFSVLEAASLLVLGMLGFGIFGALTHPPDGGG